LVAGTVPRDAAGIFPAREPDWDGRLLGRGTMDRCRQPVLSALASGSVRGHRIGTRRESPSRRHPLPVLCVRGTDRKWTRAHRAGDRFGRDPDAVTTSRERSLAFSTRSFEGAIDLLFEVFPIATEAVGVACRWLRGLGF